MLGMNDASWTMETMTVTCGAQEAAIPGTLLHSLVSGVGFSSDRRSTSEVASVEGGEGCQHKELP